MKKLLVVLAAVVPLLAPVQAFADRAATTLDEDQVSALVASAPGAAEHPEAGALILYQGQTFTVEPDGEHVVEEHLLVRILKDRGRHWGDQKRMFDSRTDSVAVLTARTWLADGTTVPVEDKAINVITPPELAGASIYTDIRQKVVSFGQIAPGVVVEILTRTVSEPDSGESPAERPYWDTATFRQTDPILEKKYCLEIPAGSPEPTVHTANGLETVEPESDAQDGIRRYMWRVKDMPMIERVPNMPPMISYAPLLMFTSVDTWQSLGLWLAERYYPSAGPDERIREMVAGLTRDCETEADIVRSLTLFVTREVRNISLPLPLTGYRPTPAGEVLANRYGHELDKCVLLSAMLSAAGLESYPVLRRTDQTDRLVRDVPSAAQFGTVSVFVPGTFHDSTFTNPYYGEATRHGLWLFPTARYNRYGFFNNGQGNGSLVVLPSGGTIYVAPEFPPEKSLSLSTCEYTLSGEGNITGRIETLTDGLFDAHARLGLRDLTPRELERYMMQAANSLGEGAAVGDYSLSDLEDLVVPATVDFAFQAPEVGVVQGEMMILRLPMPPFSFTGLPYFPDVESRDYDFITDGPFMNAQRVKIILPEGWKVAHMPEALSAETSFGSWGIECTRSGGEVDYTRRIRMQARLVGTEDYPRFKELFERFTHPRNTLLLLERE